MNENLKPGGQCVLDFLSEQMMQMQIHARKQTRVPAARKLSMQMRAVLLIFNADPHLMTAVSPFINLETETIHWEKINRLPFGSGHRSAVQWAYAAWTDEKPKGNCFEGALGMSPFLKVAVLEAFCLRWGLRG